MPSPPPDLKPVLGGGAEAWKVAPVQGPAADFTVADDDGQPVAAVGPNGLTLTTAESLPIDSEVVARFRLTSPQDRGTTVTMLAGLPKPDDAGAKALWLSLGVPAGPKQETVIWNIRALPGEKDNAHGYYTGRSRAIG